MFFKGQARLDVLGTDQGQAESAVEQERDSETSRDVEDRPDRSEEGGTLLENGSNALQTGSEKALVAAEPMREHPETRQIALLPGTDNTVRREHPLTVKRTAAAASFSFDSLRDAFENKSVSNGAVLSGVDDEKNTGTAAGADGSLLRESGTDSSKVESRSEGSLVSGPAVGRDLTYRPNDTARITSRRTGSYLPLPQDSEFAGRTGLEKSAARILAAQQSPPGPQSKSFSSGYQLPTAEVNVHTGKKPDRITPPTQATAPVLWQPEAVNVGQTLTNSKSELPARLSTFGRSEGSHMNSAPETSVAASTIVRDDGLFRVVPVPGNALPEPDTFLAAPSADLLRKEIEGRPFADVRSAAHSVNGSNLPVGIVYTRPELPQVIARQVVASVSRSGVGGRSIELSLAPSELGKVQMRLTSNDGQITVNLLAERPETLDLMRRHAEVLERALHEVGYEHAQFTFSQEGQSAQHDFGGHPQGAPQREHAPGEAVDVAPNPKALDHLRVTLGDRLDVLI
ncbi:flagellar hook-length control protein FliK [uncultured Roseovarius sp.]|uniref:flagellar hook-length control protein FliK n=1 Tax=uncultured Roseovarius sp. TaxID=293344 RepID=UPI0026299DF8|nr:flagellar hook-length control protein FliK [uncultured Roseovarius sp.]